MTKPAEKIDLLDYVHDLLSEDESGSILQATVEGHLDGPMSAVVAKLGKGDECDRLRVAIVLNNVCRTLRDAYGREAYDRGAEMAQADLYLKGGEAVATELVESAREMNVVASRLGSAVEEVASAAIDCVGRAQARERRFALAGGLGGMLGTSASFASVLAMLWYTGGITFH